MDPNLERLSFAPALFDMHLTLGGCAIWPVRPGTLENNPHKCQRSLPGVVFKLGYASLIGCSCITSSSFLLNYGQEKPSVALPAKSCVQYCYRV